MNHAVKKREAEFVKSIRCLEHRAYIEQYFLLSAAPVLAGVKPAVLISFRHCCDGAWISCKAKICNETGLNTVRLYENKETFAILIYDEKQLDVRVRSPMSKKLLFKYGYKANSELTELINFLKFRFSSCKFPHEIGLFLGYPPEDVGAFIENNGKGYLCCRYWKVYHNEQNAMEIFRFIDEAKAIAINLLKQKNSIKTAARMLAQMKTA